MATLLVKNALRIVTMNPGRQEIADGALLAKDGIIEAVGPMSDMPREADVMVNARGCVVVPGLINTHHHLYQNMTRAVPAAQDALLFGWLKALYPIWARMGPEEIQVSALLGLAELAFSGCTCSADHLYLFPNGARLDDEVEAALEIGVRLHATRGAMSVGESAGGLPPDDLVEPEAAILEDCLRVIRAFHDPEPGAMIRVAVAPCSPFSVSRELMRDAAVLAREHDVMLHTHLAENGEDVAFSLEMFGVRPGAYAEELGWTGADVWHAHCVKLDAAEIDLFARSKTGVAHCPCSNMRLGSGIAPVRALRDAGVKVGLGVDGSASNDAANLMAEARQAMLLQRVEHGADAMSAREALEIATLGGAAALGRPDLGALTPGRRADFAVFPVDGDAAVGMSGVWDPIAGLLMSGPLRARDTYVEGKPVIRDGRLVTMDLRQLIQRHRQLAEKLMA